MCTMCSFRKYPFLTLPPPPPSRRDFIKDTTPALEIPNISLHTKFFGPNEPAHPNLLEFLFPSAVVLGGGGIDIFWNCTIYNCIVLEKYDFNLPGMLKRMMYLKDVVPHFGTGGNFRQQITKQTTLI